MRLGLGLGMPSSGRLYTAEAEAIFAAFTTPPTGARRLLIDAMVRALIAGGVWTLLDVLYVFAAADSQAALINWKNPGTFNATLVNSPTFTADRGFTGDGATSYVNSGFTPSTAGGIYSLNSAHVAARALTDVAAGNATRAIGNVTAPSGGRNSSGFRDGTNNVFALVNSSGGALSVANTDTSDHFITNRSASNAVQIYKAGSSIGSNSTASTTLPDTAVSFLRDGTVFSSLQVASATIGGSLSSTLAAALHAAELAYMQGVGAA